IDELRESARIDLQLSAARIARVLRSLRDEQDRINLRRRELLGELVLLEYLRDVICVPVEVNDVIHRLGRHVAGGDEDADSRSDVMRIGAIRRRLALEPLP